MDTIASDLYRTTVTSTGGRDGTVRSDDGALEVSYASPTDSGKAGSATNPEQLFGAGLASCFHEALVIAASEVGADAADSTVTVEVRLGTGADEGVPYVFAAQLTAALPGVDADLADRVVALARTTCPFTRAVDGNIELEVSRG